MPLCLDDFQTAPTATADLEADERFSYHDTDIDFSMEMQEAQEWSENGMFFLGSN